MIPGLLLAVVVSAPTAAEQQAADPGPHGADGAHDLGEITVTAARPRGAAATDIPVEISFDAEQLRSFGAGDITELLAALEPQTRSSRGGGPPVTLLNGRRISGRREIRGLPVEAIERVDVLPEEAALAYGYRADQRVVNFVLKTRFDSLAFQAESRRPERGGRTISRAEANALHIDEAGRWSFDIEGRAETPLFETERDNRREASGGAAMAGRLNNDDLTAYRTLSPRRRNLEVSGALARDLNANTSGTVSFGLEDDVRLSYRGLPEVRLSAPGYDTSPFSETVWLNRFIDAPGTEAREVGFRSLNAGAVVEGYVGDWRWTLNGAYDQDETDTRTGRGLDASAPQAAITAGSLDLSAALPDGLVAVRPFDTARSVASTASAELVMNGNLREVRAGDLDASFKLGLDRRELDSESVRSGLAQYGSLSRDRISAQASFKLALANRRHAVRTALGDLSVNLNLGYEDLSDFGGLSSVGLGFNWSPVVPLSFLFSYTDDKTAPSLPRLNDPTVLTPNRQVFDFATGQTVSVMQITGGAAGLEEEHRSTLKLGVNLKPFEERNLRLSLNYTRTQISDAIMGFSTLTPDLEAALPERFARDAEGALVSIDARPLNFAGTERQEIRWGMNFSTAFGKPSSPIREAGQGAEPVRQPAPRPGRVASGDRGPRASLRTEPSQGRMQLSLYHTWRLRDEVIIRDGLPVLDLLDGAATGSSGGPPRHEVQLSLSLVRNGLGGSFKADWRDSTRVAGKTRALAGQDLTFSDLALINLNLFAELSASAASGDRFNWLRGVRVSFGVDNLFDKRMSVKNALGETPANYQPDYIDPMGRTFRLSLRKILF